MAKRILIATLALFPVAVFAAGAGVPLEKANINLSDTESLQRGARSFVNYCLGCHTAQYVRYNRVALDLGISEQQLVDNLMFTGGKPHDMMLNSMAADDSRRWFGQPPPDLSLLARARGADYVYTFLKTFYLDDTKVTGVNNLVLPGASMPHVLWELQGLQKPVYSGHVGEDGNVSKHLDGFEQVTEGMLSPEEYDGFVRDLTNFLTYISEPVQLKRKSLGTKVLMFLFVFFLLSYMLKKEYWKDVD